MSKSTYFVYEVRPDGKYHFKGTVLVEDGEKAKEKARAKFFPGWSAVFGPKVRVSTCPLGSHVKNCLLPFLEAAR